MPTTLSLWTVGQVVGTVGDFGEGVLAADAGAVQHDQACGACLGIDEDAAVLAGEDDAVGGVLQRLRAVEQVAAGRITDAVDGVADQTSHSSKTYAGACEQDHKTVLLMQ